jgi:hypothetical protein
VGRGEGSDLGVTMIKKLVNEMHALAWTLGGTGLVLITLSGSTLKWGVWISVASLAVHLIGVLLHKDED